MQLDIPPHGRELAGAGTRFGNDEFGVYHFLVKGFVRCTPDGEMLNRRNEMGYIFDDLATAQGYCRWKVNDNPKIACTVYDSKGKVVDQIFNSEYLERVKRKNAPKRQLLLGTLLLTAGCLLIWFDSRRDWTLILGFLIGARLAVGGAVKLSLAVIELRGERSTRD